MLLLGRSPCCHSCSQLRLPLAPAGLRNCLASIGLKVPHLQMMMMMIAIFCSRADSLRSHVTLHEWLAFYCAFLNIHRSGVLTALAWLVPHETDAILVQVQCTLYNHAPSHFMQSHICKVYACLAVTCHLHLLLAEWPGSFRCYCGNMGWNRYQSKSQHRKLT